MKKTWDSVGTRTKLLDAARDVIRAKAYTATTVKDICESAGVTKGSFSHHFQSKKQLGIAAADQFGAMAAAIFASTPYRQLPDSSRSCAGLRRFSDCDVSAGDRPVYLPAGHDGSGSIRHASGGSGGV